MYCTYCGRETSGQINYCSSCGYRLNSPREMQYATIPPVYAEVHDQVQSLKGISGWLMFFCLIVTVAAPLILFLDWHADRLAFVRTIFGLVTGVMVWSVRPTALGWLRSYFAIAMVTRIGALIVFGMNYSGAYWFEQFTGHLIALVITIAWIAYFLFSARVKATFGSNL
jgi:hypothetical protein